MTPTFISGAKVKAVIDIILVVVLFWCFDSAHGFPRDVPKTAIWLSTHCWVGTFFVLLMSIHVWQHWRFICVLFNKTVIWKNKITFLVTLVFVMMSCSILGMLSSTNASLGFHHVLGNPFMILMLIHTGMKIPSFIRLFRSAPFKLNS